jgi:hypothetical protein
MNVSRINVVPFRCFGRCVPGPRERRLATPFRISDYLAARCCVAEESGKPRSASSGPRVNNDRDLPRRRPDEVLSDFCHRDALVDVLEVLRFNRGQFFV